MGDSVNLEELLLKHRKERKELQGVCLEVMVDKCDSTLRHRGINYENLRLILSSFKLIWNEV